MLTQLKLTVKFLYATRVIACQKVIDLFSGFPMKLSPATSTDELFQGVEPANDILRTLFETALQALKEPSFYAPDWRAVLDMFGEVIKARLDRANALNSDLDISHDDIYTFLWNGTIDLLIDVEKTILEPDHAALNFYHLKGLLGSSILLKQNLPSSLRFIDNLARARSQLWQAYRPTVFPAVATLSLP